MIAKQNELMELLRDGFFNGTKMFEESLVDSSGKIDLNTIVRLWDSFKGRKYTLKYYMEHGDIMPTWGVPNKYRDPDDAEKVYRECLMKDTTWREEIGYEEPPDGTVY